MDYESAYKQALERAKSMMALPDDKAMIEEIFPELAEPDDEKIRKELIDYFSASHVLDTFRGISWDRIVYWLERVSRSLLGVKRISGFGILFGI